MADDGGMTRLVLVRHGQSQVQVDRVVGGPSACTGLSELGRRQVAALRDRWADTKEVQPDRLLSSTLARAQETAEILAPAFPGALQVESRRELAELEPGECDGLTWEDYVERYAVDMRSDPYAPLSPGGESVAEFLLRVGRTLHGIAKDEVGRTVVIACHGGIVDGSIACFLGLPTQRGGLWHRLDCTNSSVTEWTARVRDGHPVDWTLHRYNDAAHLAAAGVERS